MNFLDFGRFAVALFLAMFSACFLSVVPHGVLLILVLLQPVR